MNFIDIFKAIQPKVAKGTFLSSAHETFSTIDNISRHESTFKRLKSHQASSMITIV